MTMKKKVSDFFFMTRTLTEEHDTTEDVGRNADTEDKGIDVADEDVLYVGECLKGDDVIGVVPRNKAVCATIVFAIIKNLHP